MSLGFFKAKINIKMVNPEQQTNSKEQQAEDRTRFMKMVRNVMRALNENPKTRMETDLEGKPLTKSLVDDVQVLGGEARLWIKIKPSEDPKHPSQPVTLITRADRFDSYSSKYPEIRLAPVTRLEYFADGHLGVYYGDSVEDIDEVESEYLSGVGENEADTPSRVDYFEIDLESVNHEDYLDGTPYDDWNHVEGVEEAVESLLVK
jgi:hypothetical protein